MFQAIIAICLMSMSGLECSPIPAQNSIEVVSNYELYSGVYETVEECETEIESAKDIFEINFKNTQGIFLRVNCRYLPPGNPV